MVLFPGGGVWDRSPPDILSGSIKYVEQTLAAARSQGPIDILLQSYELPYEYFGGKERHYAGKRNSISYHGQNALQQVVLPLLLQAGERLDQLTPEQLIERISHLTLFSHSYGSIVTQDVADCFALRLSAAGFSAEDTARIMKEMVAINVAPIARIDFGAPNFTHFHFRASNDMAAIDSIRYSNPDYRHYVPMLDQCGYWKISRLLDTLGESASREALLKGLQTQVERLRRPGVMPLPVSRSVSSGYSFSAMLPDTEIRWLETQHDGSEVCRILNQEIAQQQGGAVAHDYRNFLHGEHRLGEVLINVGNHAVQRAPGMGDGTRLTMTDAHTAAQHATKWRHHIKAQVSERAIAEQTPRR